MSLIVQKYGGTSVSTTEKIKLIATHIAETVNQDNKLLVVVSAMGQHTNELTQLAKEISSKPVQREMDMLLTVGERITMALMSMALADLKITAISLTGSQSGIWTDASHGNARIQDIKTHRISESLEKYKVVIVAGFQGMNPESKEITTLGRGGSDLTALAIAKKMNADICELYKDVDGVYTSDPRYNKEAKLIKKLPWDLLEELTWNGAGIVHSRAAFLARKYQIPFTIRPTAKFNNNGTTIQGLSEMESLQISAITHKNGLRTVVTTSDQKNAMEKAQAWLWENGEAPIVCQLQARGKDYILSQIIPDNLLKEFLNFTSKDLSNAHTEHSSESLTSISIVGSGFRQSPEFITKIMKLVKAPILYTEVNTASVMILVTEEYGQKTIDIIHKNLFET